MGSQGTLPDGIDVILGPRRVHHYNISRSPYNTVQKGKYLVVHDFTSRQEWIPSYDLTIVVHHHSAVHVTQHIHGYRRIMRIRSHLTATDVLKQRISEGIAHRVYVYIRLEQLQSLVAQPNGAQTLAEQREVRIHVALDPLPLEQVDQIDVVVVLDLDVEGLLDVVEDLVAVGVQIARVDVDLDVGVARLQGLDTGPEDALAAAAGVAVRMEDADGDVVARVLLVAALGEAQLEEGDEDEGDEDEAEDQAGYD